MCGIAGIIQSQDRVSEEKLRMMTDVISHRGPDGEGAWINQQGNAGLGHRRLSIIDLSVNAGQPMHYRDGRYTITFNGEIYNYIELKKELLGKGITFRSDSDTEVLLALYAEKGEHCLGDLDGMFAFAIWDETEQTLFCARDRFGEKPFYYHFVPGQSFLFASEIKQFFAYGISKEVEPVMAYNYLLNPNALSDPLVPSRTFYKNILKLEPGHFLKLNRKIQLSKKRYWDIDLSIEKTRLPFDDAVSRFRELFERSVSRRLRSDVAVGSSLSGGLDSSSIVCLINEIRGKKGAPQKTFSARFRNFEKDEGKFMEAVIGKTGVEAHFTWPDEHMLIDDFQKLLFHQDEPFGSASIFAQWSVMKLAKEQNVTVLLDGQGADETLAGYIPYFETYLHELYLGQTSLYQEELNAYRSFHNPGFRDFGAGPEQASAKQSGSQSMKSALKNMVRPLYRKLVPLPKNPDFAHAFLTKEFVAAFSPEQKYAYGTEGNLKQQLYYSTFSHGLEDLLRYCDRNSMAFSREVRLPFLEHELVSFIFSLPSSFKMKEGWSKYLLRKSMETILPAEITWRVDKIGYAPPQERWMSSPGIKEMIRESELKLEAEKILDPRRNKETENTWAFLLAGKMLY